MIELTQKLALTAADYQGLTRSGICRDLTDRAGIFRVSSPEGAVLVGQKTKSDRDFAGIAFPYLWPGVPRVREVRLRRDSPDLEQLPDGKTKQKNKYLSPPGRGNLLYFSPDAKPQWLKDSSVRAVFVEGEKKTLSTQAFFLRQNQEVLVVGIAGVWGFRGKVGIETTGSGKRQTVKGVIADIERINWSGRDVEIIYDTDAEENSKVYAARRALLFELRARKASPRIFPMPPFVETNAKGIDDLIGANGDDFVADWLQIERNKPEKIVSLAYTDEGFLNRFCELYENDFAYVADLDACLAWDGQKWDGQHGKALLWQALMDASHEFERQEKDSAFDPDKCERFFAKYCSTTGLQSVTRLAELDVRFRRHSSAFDQQPWLLNCQNGTLDLKTAELRDFERDDLLTHQIGVQWNPKAKCNEWETFLCKFTGMDAALRGFVLAWLFYNLTADTSAQIFTIWQGKPNSGKGTIARVMQALLGKSLAKEAARGAFCHKEYDNVSHQDFLAQLKGRRFVIQSEFEDKKLDTGLIKQVSGQDSIYASAKGKSGDDYVPTYKLNLFSNLPPIFNVEDEAIHRRMRVIPCDYTPTAEELADKDFEARLHAELPGILVNLVTEGRELFFQNRLASPEKMRVRTGQILDAQNPFKEWLLAFYEVPAPKQIEAEKARAYQTTKYPFKVKRSEINGAYDVYCKENGYKAVGRPRKIATLNKIGVEEVKSDGDFYFAPLRKKDD